MTNAEKYLKDGETGNFVQAFSCWYYGITRELENVDKMLVQFLKAEAKPTLTADEGVILRNIDTDNYKGIGRKNDTLYLVSATPNYFGGENDKEVFWYCFHELFQFIKERRRISNSRTFKGGIKKC